MEYTVIHHMLQIAEALGRGCCFCCMVKPFMLSGATPGGMYANGGMGTAARLKKEIFYAGAVYFLAIVLLYAVPLRLDAYKIYGIGSLIMFFFICRIDRRNYRQKAFLVMIFFSISWFSAAMAEILYDNLYAFAEYTDYMRGHPDLFPALYAGVCAFYLIMEFAFTIIAVRQILKVYRNKSADMGNKELVMLALPSLMGVMAYQIIQSHRMVYITEGSRDDYDILIMMFYAVSFVAIIIVIALYQDIKAAQEENLQAGLLAMQICSIREHIEQVESLYQNIRSVKHDMTNHILTLERLYEGKRTEEAREYSKDLKEELAQMTGGIESGNPVTDVILQEFQKKAKEREISFYSEFHYPSDSNINVFDISVILNNALQNAIENTQKETAGHISIVSYRRNNAYIIEIGNSFTGDLRRDAESGFPVTSKEKAQGHGYGLPNIRRVAEKYAGDIDIVSRDGEFCLCIMLMIE